MSNPFNFFDMIVCVNLEDRTDRKERMGRVFAEIGCDVSWRNGIRVQCDTPHIRNGFAGCLLSQKRVFEEAIAKGAKNLLLFEDDLQFGGQFERVNDQLHVLEMATKELPEDWGVLYLGMCPSFGFDNYSPHLLRSRGSILAHATAFNGYMFQYMLDTLHEAYYRGIPNDCAYRSTSYLGNHYIVNPPLVRQVDEYSNNWETTRKGNDVAMGTWDYFKRNPDVREL